MASDPASAPDLQALHAQGRDGARHRFCLQQASEALAASPAPALLERVDGIHRILLGADPGMMRRSVGWFGRLLGRDIVLQAQAEALRQQLGVEVLQARRQLDALAEHDRVLETHGASLRATIGELEQESTRLECEAAHAGPPDPSRQHVTTLAASLRIAATHLELTLRNHGDLARRIGLMLPRVELLLDQQRMLLAGITERTALQDATRALDAVQGAGRVNVPRAAPH